MRSRVSIHLLVLATLLVALPAGCERSDAAAPQVAARVNGTEITVQQVASAAAGGSRAALGREGWHAALQALDRVIERELLVQQALDARLDKDPQVAHAIEDARRQLLAQAWLERAAGGAAASTADEVRAFYRDNPALFAERRIYRLRELRLAEPTERPDLLRAEAARAKHLDEVAAWLAAHGYKFTATALTQPAEQIPLAHLPQLARMQEGEIAVLAAPSGVAVVQLVHAQDAGLTEQQAAPLIEQFLAGRKRLELAAAEVKRLRQMAAIEYVGEFKRN